MKRNIFLLIFSILLIFIKGTINTFGGTIATINSDVETEFGTYRPYSAIFTPNVPEFTVESDFRNVENFSSIEGLTANDSTLLLQNHFTVRKSTFTQFFDVYNYSTCRVL